MASFFPRTLSVGSLFSPLIIPVGSDVFRRSSLRSEDSTAGSSKKLERTGSSVLPTSFFFFFDFLMFENNVWVKVLLLCLLSYYWVSGWASMLIWGKVGHYCFHYYFGSFLSLLFVFKLWTYYIPCSYPTIIEYSSLFGSTVLFLFLYSEVLRFSSCVQSIRESNKALTIFFKKKIIF